MFYNASTPYNFKINEPVFKSSKCCTFSVISPMFPLHKTKIKQHRHEFHSKQDI